MTEDQIKILARQLRKPEGEFAFQIGERMNKGNFYINRYAIQELHIKAHEHILEIGMGNGFFVKDILSEHHSVTYSACDFSQDMIHQASLRNDHFIKNGRAKFYCSNAEQLPFKKETFDKVLTINTLYFWDNPISVFAEIRNVLKPKGQLVIAIRPKSVMDQYAVTKYGFKTFDRADLLKLLIKNHFSILRVTEIDKRKQNPIDNKKEDPFIIVRATV